MSLSPTSVINETRKRSPLFNSTRFVLKYTFLIYNLYVRKQNILEQNIDLTAYDSISRAKISREESKQHQKNITKFKFVFLVLV